METLKNILEFKLFTFQGYSLYLGRLLVGVLLVVFSQLLLRWLNKKLLIPTYIQKYKENRINILLRVLKYIIRAIAFFLIIEFLELQGIVWAVFLFQLFSFGSYSIKVGLLLIVAIVFVATRAALRGLSTLVFTAENIEKYEQEKLNIFFRGLKFIIIAFPVLFILQVLGLVEALRSIVTFQFISIGSYVLTLGILLTVFVLIVATKSILWVLRNTLFSDDNIEKYEEGNLLSLFQITKYVIWIITSLIALDTLGIKLNVILAGSAALLVGVGLGLQNTFNDFISGIILLFEGSIKVGDVLEVDNDVVKIKKIGLRTSVAINRDDIIVLLPNSIITTHKVVNWSHQSKRTRFKIGIGVAYGSDVELVMQLLKDSAAEHLPAKDKDSIKVRFLNFGNSSLDFEVFFFSKDVFMIEEVKSKIRIIINKKFTENNINIPFPQMDLHLVSKNF